MLISASIALAAAEEQHVSLLQTAVSVHQHSDGKEECKAAKGERADAKKAVKDLRAQMKALRAQLKAAKATLSEKKDAVFEACEKKEKPPVVIENKCLGARDNAFVTIPAKKGKCYSEVKLTHKSGQVSCAGPTWMANFGCGNGENAIVLVQHGTPSGKASQQKVLAPVDGTEGYSHSGRGHGHWYHMEGIGKTSPVMTWKLGSPIQADDDAFDLWFSEDLTDESESDNMGEVCYDVELTSSKC